MQRLRASEALPSWEEQNAQRIASSAQQEGQSQGSLWGSVAGALLGLAGAIPTAGASIPAGISMGNQIGGAIGGWVGGDQAQHAADTVSTLETARQAKLAKDEARRRAFAALINRSPE